MIDFIDVTDAFAPDRTITIKKSEITAISDVNNAPQGCWIYVRGTQTFNAAQSREAVLEKLKTPRG